MTTTKVNDVRDPPEALKLWFKIHFMLDYLIGLPLFLFPIQVLEFLNWNTIDPVASRIAAAALFGIGGISLVAQNSSIEIYRILLKLKLIWSIAALIGILGSIIQFDLYGSLILWAFFGTFLGFNMVWIYWIKKLD